MPTSQAHAFGCFGYCMWRQFANNYAQKIIYFNLKGLKSSKDALLSILFYESGNSAFTEKLPLFIFS